MMASLYMRALPLSEPTPLVANFTVGTVTPEFKVPFGK